MEIFVVLLAGDEKEGGEMTPRRQRKPVLHASLMAEKDGLW